jgi:CMP-N,N'-diacetyllegionaminic acid synthase
VSGAVRYLGVVPARAGSKGIPGKNLADLGGVPMLRYTLDAALGAARLDRVVLTSDDERALDLAAELCFPALRRPSELALDEAPMLGAVLHAVDAVEEEIGGAVENVVLLQPTSPFRDAADVDAAVAAFEAASRSTLVSVVAVSQHPCEVVRVEDGRLRRAVEWPEGATGRQALPDFFFVTGAIYVARTAHLRSAGTFQDENSAIFPMEHSHSFDIDDRFDLDLARGLLAGARSGA